MQIQEETDCVEEENGDGQKARCDQKRGLAHHSPSSCENGVGLGTKKSHRLHYPGAEIRQGSYNVVDCLVYIPSVDV